MAGIPPALDSDAEDVVWALQTAEALWKRNERADAVVWLRRAAQAAGEARDDDRALALARASAELAEWMAQNPSAEAGTATPSEPPAPDATSAADGVDELLRATQDEEAEVPTKVRELPRIPSAAEAHAGMLDPWSEEAPTHQRNSSRAPAARSAPPPPPQAAGRAEADEVVTSAPPIARAKARSVAPLPPPRPPPKRTPPPPAPPPDAARRAAIDLSSVEALADLPDDARAEFARAATIHELARDEEVSGFALALVVEGAVDLAATIVDAPAARLDAGAVIRARGSIEHAAPVRLVAASDRARVASWDDRACSEAFHACPWVEDDLRAAGDRHQAMVGATMGPIGERLDAELRAHVTSRLSPRTLAEHEVFAEAGKPIPGLLVVGAGELELVDDGGRAEPLRSGDFLFPNEVLRAAPAPRTARAGRGGAVVLVADRAMAQELLVTCPPLLEIFAGM